MRRGWIGIIVLVFLATYIIYIYTQTNSNSRETILLSDFIKQTIKQEYLPENYTPTNKLTYQGKADGVRTLWGNLWNIKNMKFYADLHYNKNSTGVSDFEIFVFDNDIPEELNKTIASEFFNRYFITAGNDTSCKHPAENMTNVTYCENFETESDGIKMGLVLVSSPLNKFVAACEFPLNSEEYKFSSCVRI